jgi:DNA-binding beta-propeller fold protein YncE
MSKPVGNIVNEINLGEGEPTSILYDPKNGYTYVGFAALYYSESGIYVITNYTEVSKIPTLPPPRIMCYNPQNGDVYADLGSSISVIDGTTIVSNITLNGSISTMLYDRLNGILYVYQAPWVIAVEGNYNILTPGIMYAINVSNNTVIGYVIVGKVNSQHMLLDPSNGYIYVSLMNGSIIVITPNLKIVGTINVNISVIYSMLYDPVNGYIYI